MNIPRAQRTRLEIISHTALHVARCESEHDRDGALYLFGMLGDLSPKEKAAFRGDLRGHRRMFNVRREHYVVVVR